MHDGIIDVRSEGPRRGSEFVIRMPLATCPPRVRPEEAMDPVGIDCRVVVIDDNRDAAELMAMLVQELGWECRAAYDGESGLREVLTSRPDVVLLDIGMPGLDGFHTCRHIRNELRNDVLIVAVTGYGQAHDKDASARAGFDAHLPKPPVQRRWRSSSGNVGRAATITQRTPHLRDDTLSASHSAFRARE